MVSAFLLFICSQSTDSGKHVVDNWVLSTTPSQKVDGDLGYSNKNGADAVLHKYGKSKGKDLLKMRLRDFSAVAESTDVAKFHWKSNGTEGHLVIRSIDKRVYGSYCGQSKQAITMGTTYYPGPLSNAMKQEMVGFFQRH